MVLWPMNGGHRRCGVWRIRHRICTTAGPMTPAERLSARRRVIPADTERPDARKSPSTEELHIELPSSAQGTIRDAAPDEIAQLLLSTIQHENAPPELPAARLRGAYR